MLRHSLGLKQKIQLLVWLPVTLMFVFTLVFIVQQTQKEQSATRAEEMFVALKPYLALTSALAAERGFYLGWVNGDHSSPQLLKALETQQQKVNSLLAQLPQLTDQDMLSHNMNEAVKNLHHLRQQLQMLRPTKSREELEEKVFTGYSQLIEQLNLLIQEYAFEYEGIGQLRNLLLLYGLYDLKEAAGQERGITYGVLQEHHLKVNALRYITVAIAKQERLEKIYQWTQKDENL